MKAKNKKYTLFCIFASLLCGNAYAQFYSNGNEPVSTKWSQIRTEDYRVIFPSGMDSLAREYAISLERVKAPVGGSLGWKPNQSYRSPMPVVLHPYTTEANGFVSWCPRRMELYTVPDFYSPEPLPWVQQLSIHESRHAAQMQPYAAGVWKAAGVLVGDIAPSLLCAIMGGPPAMEGDAVVAETALSASGRGRSADFLEYLRTCFLEGDTRNYWQWRYGSQKYFCPDYYKIGYIMAAGMREYCGFDKWPFFSLTGKVPKAFPAIADSLTVAWKREAAARAPYMPCDSVTFAERRFVEYTSLCSDGKGGLIARKSGIQNAREMGRMDAAGQWRKIRSSASVTSRMKANPESGLVYWSEERKDHRWEMVSYSVIRYLDTSNGKVRDLTRNKRYFNPSVSEDGKCLAVSQSLEDGSSAVMILDAASGKELYSYPAPEGFQVLETTWINDNIYASVLGPEGIGIYFVSTFEAVLEPYFAKIKELDSFDGDIVFVSDRNGVNELYSLCPENGAVTQLTSSRQGSTDHVFAGDSLYYTILSRDGRMVYRTAVNDLPRKSVDYGELHSWIMADSLSAAEPEKIKLSGGPEIGEAEPYSRFGHLFKIHSWMPFYANTDIIESLSFNALMTDAGLGASAYFQNELSTLQGFAGYSAWTPYDGWSNAGHLRLTYSGFWPVVEVSADLSDLYPASTTVSADPERQGMKMKTEFTSGAAFDATVRAYLPLNFSSGGWNRGVIPQARWTFSNDKTIYLGKAAYSNYLSASVRAYSVRNMASSCLYPRWGIGVETGYCTKPGRRNLLVDNLYGYVYGYVPGFYRTHGIKLSILAEQNLGNGLLASPFAVVTPRGGSSLLTELSRYQHHGKLTFDYALPFAPVDWSFLSPVTYIRNFELFLHYDLSYYISSKYKGTESSAGVDLVAKLGNVLSLPYDTRIGVSCCYLSGGLDVNPFYLGMVFSVDI